MTITRKSIIVTIALLAIITYFVIMAVTTRLHNDVLNKLIAQIKTKYPQQVIFSKDVAGKIVIMGDVDASDMDRINTMLLPEILIFSNTTITNKIIDSLNQNRNLIVLSIADPVILPEINLSESKILSSFQISCKNKLVDLSQVHLNSEVEKIQLHCLQLANLNSPSFWNSKHYQEINLQFSKIGNKELLQLLDYFLKKEITVKHLIVSETDVTLDKDELQKYSTVVGKLTN